MGVSSLGRDSKLVCWKPWRPDGFPTWAGALNIGDTLRHREDDQGWITGVLLRRDGSGDDKSCGILLHISRFVRGMSGLLECFDFCNRSPTPLPLSCHLMSFRPQFLGKQRWAQRRSMNGPSSLIFWAGALTSKGCAGKTAFFPPERRND